ncbi:MAG: hypothetical protein KAI45_06325 [Melioribacteraceae bacterium]|nr:hypothetical protein [Melioribacteraceae bacterium]
MNRAYKSIYAKTADNNCEHHMTEKTNYRHMNRACKNIYTQADDYKCEHLRRESHRHLTKILNSKQMKNRIKYIIKKPNSKGRIGLLE